MTSFDLGGMCGAGFAAPMSNASCQLMTLMPRCAPHCLVNWSFRRSPGGGLKTDWLSRVTMTRNSGSCSAPASKAAICEVVVKTTFSQQKSGSKLAPPDAIAGIRGPNVAYMPA